MRKLSDSMKALRIFLMQVNVQKVREAKRADSGRCKRRNQSYARTSECLVSSASIKGGH
jgi:hypothetical protein